MGDTRRGEGSSAIYSCFSEPRTNQIYKIQCTSAAAEQKTINDFSPQNDIENSLKNEKLIEIAGQVTANANLYGYPTDNGFSGKTEVLLVRFIDYMFPASIETLETVYDMDSVLKRDGNRMLTTEQTDCLTEFECVALEIDILRRQIVSSSGKSFFLVYTYGADSLQRSIDIFDKNRCPYAVSPEMKSLTELLVYLKSILSIWRKT